jgi:hypothetical protein
MMVAVNEYLNTGVHEGVRVSCKAEDDVVSDGVDGERLMCYLARTESRIFGIKSILINPPLS